jgi:HlyD family secretion protein
MDISIQSVEVRGASAQPEAERSHAQGEYEPSLRHFSIADHERRGKVGHREVGPVSRRSSRKRRLLWLLTAVVLTAASTAGYSYRQVNIAPKVDVSSHITKPAKEVLLDLSGFVVPRTKIVVSPQVNGIVSRVWIPEEGRQVKTGELLFEVDDVRYKAEYEQAEAALAAAESQLEELENGRQPEDIAHARALYEQAKVQEKLATIEFERARKLSPNVLGQAEYDRIVTNYYDARAAVKVQKTNVDIVEAKTRQEKINAAKAEVKRAKAVRDRAKYYFDKTKIHAPADSEGKPRVFTVLQKNVNPGESIQADFMYTALCTLADLSEMEAEVEVQERDLHLLHKGMSCEVLPDAHPDRPYRGTLSRMQPLVNRQRGVVQVRVAIAAPDEYLLPDMNARVLFLKDANSPSRALGSGRNAAP